MLHMFGTEHTLLTLTLHCLCITLLQCSEFILFFPRFLYMVVMMSISEQSLLSDVSACLTFSAYMGEQPNHLLLEVCYETR